MVESCGFTIVIVSVFAAVSVSLLHHSSLLPTRPVVGAFMHIYWPAIRCSSREVVAGLKVRSPGSDKIRKIDSLKCFQESNI